MGPCEYSSGYLKCTCPSGVAESELGKDASPSCSRCGHPLTQHSDFVPAEIFPQQQHPATANAGPPAPGEPGPEICLREATVSRLAEILAEYSVVHVRGTPSSGKTVLATLLKRHYTIQGVPVVFNAGWQPGNSEAVDYCAKLYESEYGRALNKSKFWVDTVVYIIDEAQESYADKNFWTYILKSQSGRRWGPRFCLLSSYGSPSTGIPEVLMPTRTPVRFGAPQRVSLVPADAPGLLSAGIGLFFTFDEFMDVVKRWPSAPGRSPFSLQRDACLYLLSVTNGHPAAVTGLLDYIYETCRADIKHGKIREVKKSHMMRAFADDQQVLAFLGAKPVSRSFPSRKHLTIEATNTLQRTLVNRCIPFDERDPGVQLCYQMGWLQSDPVDPNADDVVCVFPTRVHEKFVEVNLAIDYKKPFPIHQFPTIEYLCEQVLRNFSKSQLQQSSQGRLSTSGKPRNPEAQFQDEFYRAFTALLGHGVGISSEWSKDADGRIDFLITEPGWGVELLRDGDRLSDHCSRFAPTGAYGDWIESGQLKDWLILDCRHSDPKRTSQREPKLWRVVFRDGYTGAVVLDCVNDRVIPEFPLLS